jgi:RnfABCDGE-type electron transport complex B subunit
MDKLMELLPPALVFIGLGALMGILLAIASKVFKVEKDEKVELIAECLPGANCGGCGYTGCSALAEAIAKGEAKVNSCSVASPEAIAKIAEVMGVEAGETVPMCAHITCAGDCNTAKKKFLYVGADDCAALKDSAAENKSAPTDVSVSEPALQPVSSTLLR